VLYTRIDERVDSYIQRGLLEEVAGLQERGYAFDLPAMSGIGYRQIGDYFQGRATLPDAIQRIKWDTHAFVRHQGNWFRRSNTAHKLDSTAAPPISQARDLLREFMHQK
jgi:tRNA dimethylallyltransferase